MCNGGGQWYAKKLKPLFLQMLRNVTFCEDLSENTCTPGTA